MPNQTPPELKARILEMTERYPTMSYLRLAQRLQHGELAQGAALAVVEERSFVRHEEGREAGIARREHARGLGQD